MLRAVWAKVGLAFGMVLCLQWKAEAQVQPTYDYWPNPVSHTNGDAWLREHHEQIAVLQPKVLVLVADNNAKMDKVNEFVKQAIYATAEGSRYHGYSDKSAKVQVLYQVAKVVDLRDQAKTRWPSIWPVKVDADGHLQFVYDGLFSAEMAAAIGIHDPKHSKIFWNLRQLFEHGVINEVWMIYPEWDPPRITVPLGTYETTARVRMYDEQMNPIKGKLDNCGGNGCLDPGENGRSNVTMRFAELNMDRAVGCFLHAQGHGWDSGLWRAIPEFDQESARFFNRKLKEQGLPMDNLYEGCPLNKTGDCWEYPNDHTLTNGALTKDLAHFKDEEWGHGCGSMHFPPNARYQYDYSDDKKVLSTCENYGLKNGPDGQDLRIPFRASAIITDYENIWGDCGGGWQVYMRQNFPGYGSKAKNEDGTAMKSWWPYLFY